jgi:hypothetical protein
MKMERKADTLDPIPGKLSGLLPCGLVIGTELHRDFIVNEITGEEEDLLVGSGPATTRMNKVLVNCIECIGPVQSKTELHRAMKTISAVDRQMLLVAIRRAGLGDLYKVKVRCPVQSCKATFDVSVDLAKLESKPMENPMVRNFEDTLGRGTCVKWHVLNGVDEEWLNDQRKMLRNNERDAEVTLAMLTRIDSLNGVELNRVDAEDRAVNALKRMSGYERNQLRNLFKEREAWMDTDIEYECKKCNAPFEGSLDVGQKSFFFPQVIVKG